MNTNFPSLGLPQAWRPLFKALDDIGWQLLSEQPNSVGSRPLLLMQHESLLPIQLEVAFWEEPEWCGNHFQNRALTVAQFRFLPTSETTPFRQLPLTGDWHLELPELQARLEEGLAKTWKQMAEARKGIQPIG